MDDNEQVPEEYDGPIIQLSISTEWDARGQHAWFKAPANWADMDKQEREEFLETEAETYASEQIEHYGVAYANHAAAAEGSKDLWGAQYSPDQLEDRW